MICGEGERLAAEVIPKLDEYMLTDPRTFPCIFLALLLRFDRRVVEAAGRTLRDGKVTEAKGAAAQRGRYYFLFTLFAYAGGLVLTIGVMHW
jgi:hypothetical protein